MLQLRPATPAELPIWSAGTAARLGRLRHLAGRVDGDGAQAEGESVMAEQMQDGALRDGHQVLALLDPVVAQPVGWLWLRTEVDTRGRIAQVQHLWLDDAVADPSSAEVMDAVERAVLGADVLKVDVYAADEVLTAVVAGRGFEPDALQLRLWLDRPDDAAVSQRGPVRLVPMSPERFDRWFSEEEESYAADLALAGLVAPEHSRERARQDLESVLDKGFETAGNEFYSALADGVEVGVLWISLDDGRAFVFDVAVHPEHRRRGHARAMLQQLHAMLAARGTSSIALSVFGWNTGARALYEGLGYVPVERLLSRRLTPGP